MNIKNTLQILLFASFFLIISCDDVVNENLEEQQIQFAKEFDITNFDVGLFVSQSADSGYVIIVGSDSIQKPINSENELGSYPMNYSLIKTDVYGNLIWINENFHSNSDSMFFIPYSIEQEIDLGYLIKGSSGSRKFNSSGEFIFHSPLLINSMKDGGFVSFFPELEIIWEPEFDIVTRFLISKHMDGGDIYWQKDIRESLIALDSNFSSLQFGDIFESNDGSFSLLGNLHYSHRYFVKTDSDGNIELAKIYYNEQNNYYSNCKKTNDDGFILQTYDSTLKINSVGDIEWHNDALSGNIHQTNDDGYIYIERDELSIQISKLDISGSEIWNKSYSSELNWKGYHNHVNADINQAHDGGYIITSSSKVSGWNHDIVLMKTDSDGNISGLFE